MSSPELEAFKDCKDKATFVVQSKVKLLSWQLYTADLISYEARKNVVKLTSEGSGRETLCAVEILSCVEAAVSEDPENFRKFMTALEKDQATYHELIRDV